MMQINQIASMIEWLDEERRRDKATIAELEQRLAQQADLLAGMQRQVNTVESDQVLIRQEALPAQKEQDILERMRQDAEDMLESAEARRLTAEREAERRFELQRESIQRAVRELADKADRLERQLANISDMQVEGDRLTNAMRILNQEMDDLAKTLEGPDRRLAFLEEQRRTDTRRLAEIETELPEYRKTVDSLQPKITLLEELAVRNEKRIQDFNNIDRDRREQIQQFIDQQQLLVQQRDQQLVDLTKRFSVHDEELQRNIERFEVWAQAYREMKRIIDDFNRIGDRLERRINEASEMQRLSEERFREEWSDWRDDDQKRWKQLTLSNDEVWRNHDREFDNFIHRVGDVEKLIPALRGGIDRLWLLERARADLYRERYQAMLHEYDTGDGADGALSNNRIAIDRQNSA